MKKRRVKNVIVKCAADVFLPLAIVFGFYVVLHGDSGPGGGFQGGVLISAAVLLIYLGYGSKVLNKVLSSEVLRKSEALAEMIYIVLAVGGLVFGVYFCKNIFIDFNLFGTETASLMNDAVGYNVLTGVGCLLLLLLSMLNTEEEEEKKEGGDAA
jgi:multisubunit Na+/H+ antiporter MnhB subunit